MVTERPNLTCAELGRQEEASRNLGVMREPQHTGWAIFYCQTQDFHLGQSQDFHSENDGMMSIRDGDVVIQPHNSSNKIFCSTSLP